MENKLSQILAEIDSDKFVYDENDKQEFIKLIKPAIGFKTSKAFDKLLSIGSSKLGGQPDLPKSFIWPIYKNEPLTFCGQFNCAEFTHLDIEHKMPKKGIIHIFIYIDQNYPAFLMNKESYKLAYTPSIENLVRTEFPSNYFKEGIFEVASISFYEHYSIPDTLGYKMEKLRSNNPSCAQYVNFIRDIEDIINDITVHQENDGRHQILGESYMNMDFSFALTSLDFKSQEEYENSLDKVIDLQKKYFPIIQFCYNDANTNMNKFGDGTAGFGLKSEDLFVLNFDKTSMGFQGS